MDAQMTAIFQTLLTRMDRLEAGQRALLQAIGGLQTEQELVVERIEEAVDTALRNLKAEELVEDGY